MTRTQRLFDLLQFLRRHRYAVSGAEIANELGISVRTLYRDIATLQAQGAAIEGEPGVGYVLRPGFTIPPLMFSIEEIEAIVLGSRWVAERGDERLALAAKDALAKIAAVVPRELREELETSPLLVARAQRDAHLGTIRDAIRHEHKLRIQYRDESRVIWPFAIGFFETARVIAAWCELRGAYRHFRVDRIESLTPTSEKYPRRRHVLLEEWRRVENIPARN